MSLDKFGRSSTSRSVKNKHAERFHFLPIHNGNFDMGNRCLINVKSPEQKHDAATKIYVDSLVDNLTLKLMNVNEKTADLDNKYFGMQNSLKLTEKLEVMIEHTLKDTIKLLDSRVDKIEKKLEKINRKTEENPSILLTSTNIGKPTATNENLTPRTYVSPIFDASGKRIRH